MRRIAVGNAPSRFSSSEQLASTTSDESSNFSHLCSIVTGFLKDKDIGSKRLCSMPDRVTNTINSTVGTVYRPTVINCYEPDMPSVGMWWDHWKKFMFHTEVNVMTKAGVSEAKRVCRLLDPIKHCKYPAITELEEEISLPLQIACLAVFDAILVHVVNLLAPSRWHGVKTSMVKALHKNKVSRTLEIVASKVYASCDIIFLQEASAALVGHIISHPILGARYHVLAPEKLDGKRDQNSIMLVAKSRFSISDDDWTGEVTAEILNILESPGGTVPIAAGDLFVVRCVERVVGSSEVGLDSEDSRSTTGRRFLLSSFHGDTNGLATIPVVDAVHKYLALLRADEFVSEDGAFTAAPLLIFGLDANTYVKHKEGTHQGVVEFAEHLADLNLATCWGEVDPRVHTTYNARTFLQPQLNKAVRLSERAESPLTDKNPKDHVLFQVGEVDRAEGFVVNFVSRDNTGDGVFLPDVPFPTIGFPSDHAIVCAELELVY